MRYLLMVILALQLFGAQYIIDFQGNRTFSKERLYKELGFEPTLWERLFGKFEPKADEKLLPTLAEELRLFYKEQGFWDANITLTLQPPRAIFLIQENDPLIVKNISIVSNFPIDDLLKLKEGERFIIPHFIAFKHKVKERLLKYGYCSYEFSPKAYVYKAQRSVYISAYLDHGDVCVVKTINVQGLKTLRKEVVLSHIYIHTGDILSIEKIEESTRRLYSLEYFDQVRFDYSKKIQNEIFMDLFLKERTKRHLYKAGIGYETDRGFLGSFSYKNLNYHTHQPQISLYYSDIKRSFKLADFYPSLHLFGDFYDVSGYAEYAYEDFDSFKQRATTLSAKLLKESRDLSYAFGVKVARYDIFDTDPCIEHKKYHYLTPFAQIFIDQRDSKIFPTKGYYIKADLESTHQYIKTEGEIGSFFPLKKSVIFAKARAGQIWASSIPPSLLFLAGGTQTNRAYSYRSIYALDSACRIGGKFLLATTLEYRKLLYEKLYGAIFWDRTYLSKKEFSLDSYVDGVGFGILYPSPIGTIKAYFGFDPSDFGQNNLSLYIGASF
ncbi:MAG: BamA/TamA family outer membrane protein [Epsilonproteobacteria bacterium]|nr:BamA/TamA family outer membrane protein [Campylobacterota bacterium]